MFREFMDFLFVGIDERTVPAGADLGPALVHDSKSAISGAR
jgi:hypothetical protein